MPGYCKSTEGQVMTEFVLAESNYFYNKGGCYEIYEY